MKQGDRKGSSSSNLAGVAYGELIRENRRKKGMSQEELGVLAHVGKNAVGAWEAGRSRPDLSSVPVICENLGISINEFFGIPEAPDQKKGKQITDEADPLFAERYLQLNEYHRQVILREMDVLIDMQDKTPVSARKLVQIYRNDLAACAGPSWGIGDDSGEPVWLYEDSVPVLEK